MAISAQDLRKAIQENPTNFIEGVLRNVLWQKQKEVIGSVFKYPKTAVRSCHASGKSFTAGNAVLAFLFAYPWVSGAITTAPTWRQVEDVLWKEIRSAYNKSKYPLGGELLQTRLKMDDGWEALGLSSDDPDKFNGYHYKKLLFVIDESSGIPKPIHDAIEGIASTGFVRTLELGNPTDPTGQFALRFKSPFYNKIRISCFDTPNFLYFVLKAQEQFKTTELKDEQLVEVLAESTEEERRDCITYPFLITPQWVFERHYDWGMEHPAFQSRCLGEFPNEGDDTLIPMRYIFAAQERWKNNEIIGDPNDQCLGVDIARFGSDRTVLTPRRGGRVEVQEVFIKQPTTDTTGRIFRFKQMHPYAAVNLDDGGVGGGVTDQLIALKMNVNPINSASSPTNSTLYMNLRAELFFHLKMLFEQGNIAIPPDDELANELMSLKYKFSNGKMVIESKDDMKKRGLSSPDKADSLMLAFAPQVSAAFLDYMKSMVN